MKYQQQWTSPRDEARSIPIVDMLGMLASLQSDFFKMSSLECFDLTEVGHRPCLTFGGLRVDLDVALESLGFLAGCLLFQHVSEVILR